MDLYCTFVRNPTSTTNENLVNIEGDNSQVSSGFGSEIEGGMSLKTNSESVLMVS